MSWLESIPTDKLEKVYQSLKDELTEHYREELRLLKEHSIMTGKKRAAFYDAEKEVVMKMIVIAGGREVVQVIHECWLTAMREIPSNHFLSPSFQFSS